MPGLSKEQTDSIKKSYLNMVGLFLDEGKVDGRHLSCLLKWAIELGLNPDDLRKANVDMSRLRFLNPSSQLEKVEAVYHLVHMICLDHVVEDVELEVASVYAEKLGFRRSLVSDLLKSIVTADTDGAPVGDIRRQVIDFMELNGEAM